MSFSSILWTALMVGALVVFFVGFAYNDRESRRVEKVFEDAGLEIEDWVNGDRNA